MSDKDQVDFYDDIYHQSRSQHLVTDEEYYQARGAAAVALYFTPAERERRIFEYGCGVGQTIANLPKAGGWDVSREARAVCQAKGLNVPETIEDVEPGAWDLVFCRHVLEHVEDPLATLRLLRRLAAPSGELYLILPRERHGQSEFTPDQNQHLFSWNFRTINNLLLRSGWFPYLNEVKHSWGYRRLLPVRRALGPEAYLRAARLVGRLWHNGELVIRCR